MSGAFDSLAEEPKRQPCSGAKGLVEEASQVLAEAARPELRDSLMGGAAAKVEHYEMVSYADLISSAQLLGKAKAVRFLKENREQGVATARRMERSGPRLLKRAIAAEGGKPR